MTICTWYSSSWAASSFDKKNENKLLGAHGRKSSGDPLNKDALASEIWGRLFNLMLRQTSAVGHRSVIAWIMPHSMITNDLCWSQDLNSDNAGKTGLESKTNHIKAMRMMDHKHSATTLNKGNI